MSTKQKSATSKKQKKLTKLVIVESPSKATTLKKYLGSLYTIKASAGHVIDLPKSTLGIDTNTFEPRYIVMRDRSKVIKELSEALRSSSEVLLASDPDREGEAIAQHLKKYFEEKIIPKLKRDIPIRRIRFSEITKDAVLNAVASPTNIEENLVNAQQGRRMIDRLFGYELGPLLWKKVKGKLSAGRVQSTALRLIVEREREIEMFVPQEYWTLDARLSAVKHEFTTFLLRYQGKRVVTPNDFNNDKTQFVIWTERTMDKIVASLENANFVVEEAKKSKLTTKPSAPFITSTLQQVANNILGWTSAKTMRVAQELYEGIDLESSRTGLITYMRTDSTRISLGAVQDVADFIRNYFGPEYLPRTQNSFSNKKSAQDAHEAIRPTDVKLHPDEIKQFLSGDQFKLYNLIWRRFTASQMAPVEREIESLSITASECVFCTSGSRIVFDGFQRVWTFTADKKEPKTPPFLEKGTCIKCEQLKPEQKFTQPLARYTEASLVKTMEELGIGRPSTYAPTMMTLFKRYYVKKDGRSLVPTELGEAVNKLLIDNFSSLVNAKFTADMEEKLDAVEENRVPWKDVVRAFYGPFHKTVAYAYEHVDSIKGAFDERTNELCEKCGRAMLKKLGKYGYFLACSGWPECSNAKPIPYGYCPKCFEGKVVEKRGGRRRAFYACTRYPECDFIVNMKPFGKVCPNDGTPLFLKSGKNNMLACLREGCGYSEQELG